MPSSTLPRVGVAVAFASCMLFAGRDSAANSFIPAGAVGVVRPGTVGCSFTECFAVVDLERFQTLPDGHPMWATSLTLSLTANARLSDAGRAAEFDALVKSLAGGDRIALISQVESGPAPVLGLARLDRRFQVSDALFPGCGAPPWTSEALKACSSGPQKADVELTGRIVVDQIDDPALEKEGRKSVALDQITLRAGKTSLAPPSDVEMLDLPGSVLLKNPNRTRLNTESLRVGDRITVPVTYSLPKLDDEGHASCDPQCWPRIKAVGNLTLRED